MSLPSLESWQSLTVTNEGQHSKGGMFISMEDPKIIFNVEGPIVNSVRIPSGYEPYACDIVTVSILMTFPIFSLYEWQKGGEFYIR